MTVPQSCMSEQVEAKMPSVFVSHGGGPSFFMDDEAFPGLGK